jgi:iron complex outermembrane receptor protein
VDKVIRDPVSGEVLFMRDDYVNISQARYRGMDFAISYDWNNERLGRFYVGAAATWLDSFTLDGDETVGSWLVAEWNGTSTLSWSKGDWGANLYGVYRGERYRELSFGSIFDQGDELYMAYTVKSQTTWNASVSYAGFWDVNVTVGVNNVFNKQPPVDPYETLGTTAGINDPEPPFYYVRLERTF